MAALREGLDDAWLEAVGRRDPVLHAYARWDRRHELQRTRFVSAVEGGTTVAYLLIWRGSTAGPMVHWVGPSSARVLLDALPDRPMLAVVPTELVGEIERRRGPGRTYPVEIHALNPGTATPPADDRARRLTSHDAEPLRAFVAAGSDRLVDGYREVDLDRVPVFGAFRGPRLVAVAKASVVLPDAWVLTGIVTAVGDRGQGFGRAVTAAAARAARAAGARPGLFVRADNGPARRVYASLGFERIGERSWIDAGADRPP